MAQKHYTPPLSRLLVRALFHEAQHRQIPMTQLADEIMQAGLKDTIGWKDAQAQQEAIRLGEGVTQYRTK